MGKIKSYDDLKQAAKKERSDERKRKLSERQKIFCERLIKAFKMPLNRYGEVKRAEAAKENDINYSLLSGWLKNDRSPDIQSLYELCKKSGCSADYLLGLIDEKTHAETDICKETGLAPEAVEILTSENYFHNTLFDCFGIFPGLHTDYKSVLNDLILAPEFAQLVYMLRQIRIEKAANKKYTEARDKLEKDIRSDHNGTDDIDEIFYTDPRDKELFDLYDTISSSNNTIKARAYELEDIVHKLVDNFV